MARERPAEWVLLALTAVAASTDAVSYLGLGKVFPANMTGNTVLLGIGISGGEYGKAGRSAVALGGFVVGAMFAGVLTAGREWRAVVTRGSAVEVLALGAACGWWLAEGDQRPASVTHGLIALVSVAMGVQSAAVNRLGLGVSTTYITGTWTNLSSWVATRLRKPAREQRQHARQALVLTCYFGAALLAGFVRDRAGAPAIAIPFGLLACLVLGRSAAALPRRGARVARTYPHVKGAAMAQTVADVMTRDPVMIDADEPIATAARQMRDKDIGAVLVEDHGHTVGILTDRDIVVRIVADRQDYGMPARQVCSGSTLQTVHPETPLAEAVELMRKQSVRRLPVVDAEQHALGMISLGDLAMERDEQSALADISAAEPNT